MSLGFFDSWNLGCPERSVIEVGEDELKLTSASFAVAAAAGDGSHALEAVRAASLRRGAKGWHSHMRE